MTDFSSEEAELVQRAIEGDGTVFGHLYKRHLEVIYRYVFYRVGIVEDAEDLTEQVFLRAWEALPNFKPANNRFVNWLYTIARNLTIDHLRRQKKTFSSELIDSCQIGQGEPSALQQVLRAEENRALANAIAELPEEQQQVILLRFVEGLRHAEVARILDRTEGACRALQFQALVTLNHKLAGIREGEADHG